jgi:hypothetical protein
VLPALIQNLEYGGGTAKTLVPMLRIAALLTEDEVRARSPELARPRARQPYTPPLRYSQATRPPPFARPQAAVAAPL